MFLAARADAMDRELRMTVLRRAADIIGGSSALQQRLGVEQHALELWLSGRATVPEWVFILAVDLVVRDDIARAAQDRRAAPREEREPPENEIAPS
jgi:DNA-binding transcriptional regulator YdaS (Cro superfamily)